MISLSNISKTMGSKQLFENLSFTIDDQQHIGLLGPNGAGKSTLLKMIAGSETADSGEISYRKGVRLAYVPQDETFDSEKSITDIVIHRLIGSGMDRYEAEIQAPIFLSLVGFENLEQIAGSLSGGWRKRLSLAVAFAQDPDVLLLDEPTNHMDWDGILWLESYIKTFQKSFVVVSHDRTFLNNICNRTMEINALYRDGFLAFDVGYQQFLVKKQDYAETQMNLQQTMSNKARREVEWLRAGVKARTTKSSARMKDAYELLDNLSAVKARNSAGKAKVRVEIDHAGKKSKKFIELKNVSVAYGDKKLVEDLDLLMGPNTCIGFVGANGSGKTSLLKAIAGMEENYSGEIFRADDLQIVYFDQKRQNLPQDINLIEFLGDGSDYTIFKDQSLHVASYASRFLFTSDKMQLKISQLSGGEQARLLIAKLLLQPADVLILDEPTNDLDINSIEVLEESLSQFGGLVLLVSHDRYFLNNLCQKYLGHLPPRNWEVFADLNQWLKQKDSHPQKSKANDIVKVEAEPAEITKKKPKLSYKEKRQMETIEQDIEAAEVALEAAQENLTNPDIFSDNEKMQQALKLVEENQKKVEELYRIWDSIEQKL